MAKPFMTYQQQLLKLEEKHLVIDDPRAVEDILHRYGYFALISGYKDLLKKQELVDARYTKKYVYF